MYKISTHIELPIAHRLKDAYSGLCVGNVYRDKGQCDGKQDRYDLLNGKVLGICHGHNYHITINIFTSKLNAEGMVIDFKLMKKIIHEYFDQYDHAMILKAGDPLIEVYSNNYKECGVDFDRSRLFVWKDNPTAEYMSMHWAVILKEKFSEYIQDCEVEVEVEETSHNSITYNTSLTTQR